MTRQRSSWARAGQSWQNPSNSALIGAGRRLGKLSTFRMRSDPTLCGQASAAGTTALQIFPLGLQFFLFGLPFHGAGGPCRLGAPRCCLALGPQLFGLLAIEFIDAPAVHVGIEHLQGSATGVDLVVMGEFGEALEDAEQVVVPRAAQALHIAGAALRAERPEPRQLVAALRRRLYD